jgi:hypothetical protein
MLTRAPGTARSPERLVSHRTRIRLARTLCRLRREAQAVTPPGPIPLNVAAIRPQIVLLEQLEARLRDGDLPVAPRGMVLVDALLSEPSSPLYELRRGSEELGRLLRSARASLEPATE